LPIYEYACKSCDHTLDALQKMVDAPLVECPACGEASLKRLISAPRFRLKGQGWYETDFKKDNQRNIAGDKDPAKADAAKTEVAKADGAKTNGAKTDGAKAESKTADKPKSDKPKTDTPKKSTA
jgi:putative FmdB family regulatory protein